MTLRTNIKAGDIGHAALHIDERRALNTFGVYADHYDSIQAALNAAATLKAPVVYLNPAVTYDLASTLTIPDNITLDGGGVAMGELNRAQLRATSALDPMITLGNYSGIRGCRINGNAKAVTGVLVRRNFNVIEANWIQGLVTGGAAVKAGGALYTRLIHNAVSNCAGYSLDALNSYAINPNAAYYGINHGHSEQNVWGARGGLRIEGMLNSVSDDFEFALDGAAVVTVGGAVQSQLTMSAPYFELSLGAANALVGFIVKGSARLNIVGGELYGDNAAGSTLIVAQTAYGLNVTGTYIGRWGTAFSGTLANNAALMVAGNYIIDTAVKTTLSNLPESRVYVV